MGWLLFLSVLVSFVLGQAGALLEPLGKAVSVLGALCWVGIAWSLVEGTKDVAASMAAVASGRRLSTWAATWMFRAAFNVPRSSSRGRSRTRVVRRRQRSAAVAEFGQERADGASISGLNQAGADVLCMNVIPPDGHLAAHITSTAARHSELHSNASMSDACRSPCAIKCDDSAQTGEAVQTTLQPAASANLTGVSEVDP